MAYQQKEGQGSLFKNERQNDRQPDLKGTILIKGVLYNLSAWKRTSQNGREYISLQAEEKSSDGQQTYGQGQQQFGRPSYGQGRQQYGGASYGQGPVGTAPGQYSAPRPGAASQPAPAPDYIPEDIPAPGLDDLPAPFGEDLPF